MKYESLKGASIALVAMGRSHVNYTTGLANGACFDETWVINAMALSLKHNRLFMLDPPSRFLDSKDAGAMTDNMVDYLINASGHSRIYSCELDERCPVVELYPLKEVLHVVKHPYFNSTVSYAVAYAIYQEVGQLTVYGADYTYASIPHYAEAGRACLEYWLAVARMSGIAVSVAPESSLLDTSTHPTEKLYGYHRLSDPIAVVERNDGTLRVGPASELKNDITTWEHKKMLVAPPEPKNA